MRLALLIGLLFSSGLFALDSVQKDVLTAANRYVDDQKPLSALFVLESFLAKAELSDYDSERLALLANHAGVLNLRQGFIAKARHYFLTVKQFSRKVENTTLKGALLYNLGLLAWLDQRIDAASQYFASAEALLNQKGERSEGLAWKTLLASEPNEKFTPIFFAHLFLLVMPPEAGVAQAYQNKRLWLKQVSAGQGLPALFGRAMTDSEMTRREKLAQFSQILKMLEELPRDNAFYFKEKAKVTELLRNWERLELSSDAAYQADLTTRNRLSYSALNSQLNDELKLIERGRYAIWLVLFVALSALTVFWVRRTLQARSLKAIIRTKETAESRLARYDALTQLLNRKVADEIVDTELKKLDQKSPVLTLVLADVDEFSRINQKYGHEIGDFVLVTVARKLSESLRAQDLVARWSGKQFLLYLPDTDSKGVQTVCEKLRSSVESELISVDYDYLKVTLTFAVINVHYSDTLSDISKQFEDVVFQGKQTGGNQVVISQD